jgi:hypothetical protein
MARPNVINNAIDGSGTGVATAVAISKIGKEKCPPAAITPMEGSRSGG